MVKLSIVIPYYETYELTKKLLISLLTQINTPEIEIILIDDGCNEIRFDNYMDFINGYFKYDNVKIIHQENGGVSVARNKGIELAKGKYIAFIDSDDMVMPDYIEKLLNLINTRDEDVIVFNWLDITTNQVIVHPENPAVWKAIYKKEIIPRFDETLRVREDYFFQQELESKNPTKYYYDRVLYIYNSEREGSLWWNETHK